MTPSAPTETTAELDFRARIQPAEHAGGNLETGNDTGLFGDDFGLRAQTWRHDPARRPVAGSDIFRERHVNQP